MKKTVLLTIGYWLLGVGFATAQRYVVVDNETPVAVSDVEKITYESDEDFKELLLPGHLAADPKTQLFSQALEATGLADTLRLYWIDYKCPYSGKYRYKSHTWNEVAWYNTERFRMFTVFAETDDVLAAQGISSLNDLKAYAKRVYDAVYSEDAGVSDPKDRRNSLNRFVAYHILRHGSTYYYLTAYDNYKLMYCFDRNLADIAAWYATLMPGAAMKCSYPDAGDESGLYLNRRGLKDGPDKYGKQIRGAKIVADGDGKDPFTHSAFNGYYYYIDRMLTYDQQTRDDVLGGERWRVDAKTLSPDIMNVFDRYDFYENYTDSYDPNAPDAKNYIFAWDGIENFSNATDNPGLISRRPRLEFSTYEGDEMNVFGDFDFTIKLPPLPAGEWEVRFGNNAGVSTCGNVRVWLNGTLAINSLSLNDYYQESSTLPYKIMKGPKEYGHYDGSGASYNIYPFCNSDYLVRIVLGRIQSDGKSDNYLRIKCLSKGTPDPDHLDHLVLDYLEFCPASICDNTVIPED